MPGLCIGIPTLGRLVSLEWAFAFKSINPPINYNVIFSVVHGKPVAFARNLISEEALKQNCKYLLFIGDDTIPPPHTLRQLIYRMEQDPLCGVVGGVYCSKSEPPAPLVFRGNGVGSYWDWKVGEFFEVTGLGMDCTLVRVEVLQELAKKDRQFFKTLDTDQFLDGVNNAEMWTEDLYFCKRVLEETNYKVWCDASIIAKHFEPSTGISYTLPSYSLPTRKFNFENGKKIIDIGCGHVYREFEEGIPIRVDLDESCNPDYRCDVQNLPFANNEFDIVFSSHVLEHFSREKQEVVLDEWIRVLRPDGELRLILPNLMWAVSKLYEKQTKGIERDIWNVIYGGQSNILDYHYNGFTPDTLHRLLNSKGFEIVKQEESGYNLITTSKRIVDAQRTPI